MFILGHLGFTAAGLRLAQPRASLRTGLAMALLPDLIDKPLAALLPALVNDNTRGFGHTLLGALVVLAALFALRRRLGPPLLLWACYLGHFLLDRMWIHDGPTILFWPFLGDFPPPVGERLVARLMWRYNLAAEALGAALLAWVWWDVRKRRLLRRAG